MNPDLAPERVSCRQCDDPTNDGGYFCDDSCKDKYWGPLRKNSGRSLSIPEMQSRLLDHAKAVRHNAGPGPNDVEIEQLFLR